MTEGERRASVVGCFITSLITGGTAIAGLMHRLDFGNWGTNGEFGVLFVPATLAGLLSIILLATGLSDVTKKY